MQTLFAITLSRTAPHDPRSKDDVLVMYLGFEGGAGPTLMAVNVGDPKRTIRVLQEAIRDIEKATKRF